MCEKGGAFTWKLSNVNDSYSMFGIFQTGRNSNSKNYLVCSGFEIYGSLKVLEHNFELREEVQKLTYESDMDKNGLVYYMGTNDKTEGFRNPAESGRINVTSSSIQSDSQPMYPIMTRVGILTKLDEEFFIASLKNFKKH